MSKQLSGKVALVTGGSRGIGAAIALALAEEGADVAISYVASADKAEAVVRSIESKGVRAIALKADQADPSQVEGVVTSVLETFGSLDILINNAGISVTGPVDSTESDVAALDRQQAVNYSVVVTAIRAASKVMREGGRIVTIGSVLGKRSSVPGIADYSATKAAVVGFSKGAARDLGPRNITVNVVETGATDTDMNPSQGPSADMQKALIALGRFARPEEIAAGVVFLASPAASYVTGSVLAVDGGFGA